ncbi:MAG: ABC transporter ATP-binding protein [Eubacteriales bacterium]|nr:ABC transporter ATP-binding protein [Lachnospiraceae bacterium]MDO5126462.1 ABC transporter ATP-binding protein [Eubacteriales bacterium]
MDTIMTGNSIKKCFRVGGEDFLALKGVDIEIPKSKLTILKGRSGSGKTTLLNALSTLDTPTSGDVCFDGVVYSSLSEAEKEALRRKDIGFVFQSVALIPIMNAYENVDFALRLADWKGDKRTRITDVLSLVRMEERALHMPGQMSGGEQQRIAIARAIAHTPKIVFADEPTGALDTDTGIKVMRLFKSLIEHEGVTIVMTTHDPNLMQLGDVVYEMEDGELVERIENN